MGTRHQQKVINKKGETKVSQYGQWDGYPDGQGVEILNFLNSNDLIKYEKSLNNIKPVTQKVINRLNKWVNSLGEDVSRDVLNENPEYYALNRDCGSNIHRLIYDNKIEYVDLLIDEDSWCEGFYTIDFKENTFTTEFHGYKKVYNLDKLPTESKYIKDYETWKKKNKQ